MASESLQLLLAQLKQRGIRLQVDGAELKIQAPRGHMTAELQQQLRRQKQALIQHLSPLKMRFSLFFFGVEAERGARESYDLIFEAVRFADAHGFTAVWTPERHFHPLGGPFPNPAVLAAALATQTRHLQLRAGSVVLPLQDPIRVAEEWAVVDQLSRGRVALSFASGWHSNDFALAPEHYAQRHQLMMERAKTVRALWRGETIQRLDGQQQPIEITSYPRPQQAELPVWLTAIGNPEAYRRTGHAGYHLLTALLDQNSQELGQKLRGYRQALAESGFDPQSRQVAVFMHSYLGADREQVKAEAQGPFQNYLRQTLHLLGRLSQSLGLGLNPAEFSPEDQQAVLDFAYERYFEEQALLGDLAAGRRRVRQLMQADVQEIACLVDFGLPRTQVMQGLEYLAQLVAECRGKQ